MNEIEAEVCVVPSHIQFIYTYNNVTYTIEVPKTENNKMLKTGDKVMVFLSMALGLEKDA